jgi:hypothetical protein
MKKRVIWNKTYETRDEFWYDKTVKCGMCHNVATHLVSRDVLQTKLCHEHALEMELLFQCTIKLIEQGENNA